MRFEAEPTDHRTEKHGGKCQHFLNTNKTSVDSISVRSVLLPLCGTGFFSRQCIASGNNFPFLSRGGQKKNELGGMHYGLLSADVINNIVVNFE